MITGENESFPDDQSILDRLRREHRGTPNLAFAALSLTDEPVEVRQQFLREYAESLRQTSEDPAVVADPDGAARLNIANACGTWGSSETAQRYLNAWKEADPAISHPDFGDEIPSADEALHLGSVAEVANDSSQNPELDPLKTTCEALEAQGFLVRMYQGFREVNNGCDYVYKAVVLGKDEIEEVREQFRVYGADLTSVDINWDHAKDRPEVYEGENAEDAFNGAVRKFFDS